MGNSNPNCIENCSDCFNKETSSTMNLSKNQKDNIIDKQSNQYDSNSSQINSQFIRFLKQVEVEQFDKSLLVKSNSMHSTNKSMTYSFKSKNGNNIQIGNFDSKGYKTGFGIQKWANGHIFMGQWVDGKANGPGWIQTKEENTYQIYNQFGQFKDNAITGLGMIKHSECSIKGMFSDEQMDSIGQEKWKDEAESTQLGMFKDGQKDGFGLYYWADGSRYFGAWSDNNMHGVGLQQFDNSKSKQYEGEFNEGKIQGWGQFVYPNNKTYKGQWVNDKKHGQGIQQIAQEGVQQEAEFVEGKPQGFGIIYEGNGVYQAWFENGNIKFKIEKSQIDN